MKKRVWLHCFEVLMSDKSFLSRALKKDQETSKQIPLLFKTKNNNNNNSKSIIVLFSGYAYI